MHNPSALPSPESSKSFWLSEPDEVLRSYRSTLELPQYADVVIIGCGITGANAARILFEKKPELTVTVMEAREVCSGATGRNGGHVQPLLFDRTPEIANFELKNCAAVRDYIKKHDVACEYTSVTGCRTFWTNSLLIEAEAQVAELRKLAPKMGQSVSIITGESDLTAQRVHPNCAGATLTLGAASLWPYKLVVHMVRDLVEKKAVNLQTNTPVESITPLESTENTQARWTVVTKRGSMVAKYVILATNGYASHLLPLFSDLIVPVRGTMTALFPPQGYERLPDSYGFVGAGPGANPSSDDYLIQRPSEGVSNPKEHLMFGGGRAAGTSESIGETDDSFVDRGSLAYLKKQLPILLDLGGKSGTNTGLEDDFAWSGIMGYSKDNAPWVGAVPDAKGLFLSAGYTGHGMPNATLCADAVIHMLLSEERGEELAQTHTNMVMRGHIPVSYLITKERIAEASVLPSVKEQDSSDLMGFFDGKWTIRP
ncbi:FAD dependent oxidoreductase [Tothia fuscella]|uniref:FAD dependent oxidoreductase n=1 Tax=Tothia fuscella TaxID=1048955 RepID=A0A9P4NXM6_9PEZI|nr:FAD dependent oxidoreductase [Tothia fuscella]